jgi:hypothetical protein
MSASRQLKSTLEAILRFYIIFVNDIKMGRESRYACNNCHINKLVIIGILLFVLHRIGLLQNKSFVAAPLRC